MDWKNLPPVTALRAFAAYAQTGSVQQAGAQLNVSHAAISQQLRQLESHMNVTLLDRSGRSMALTPEGARLAKAVKQGFEQIADAVVELTGADHDRPLHVSTTPMFAAAWLMPRLSGFHAAYPGTGITISTTPEVQPLHAGGIDVALRYGGGDWQGSVSEPLVLSPMIVVAAPSLVGNRVYHDMNELSHLPWLQDIGVTEATNWLEKARADQAVTGGVTHVPGNLLLDGARDGQGVAIMVKAFVQADIASGRLRELFSHEGGRGYHIVTRPGPQRPVLKLFLKWLRMERKKG